MAESLSEKGDIEPRIFLTTINKACDTYKNHHENRELTTYNRGYPTGMFSFARHLGGGIKQAELFMDIIKIRDFNDPDRAERWLTNTVLHFLNHKDTHFHAHSLSTYLMDAIIEQKNLPNRPNEKTGEYSLEDRDAVVQAIKNDTPQPVVINYWSK